ILTCVFRKVMLCTPPKVSLFGIRKLLSISHAAFFPYEPLRNTNYETMTRSGGYELRKIYVLAGLNDGRHCRHEDFQSSCHVTIGRYWYLFKRLTAVSAKRFYRFEHIVLAKLWQR